MPEFRAFYTIYDQLGNIPRPGIVNPQPTHRAVITGPMEYKGQDAIKHELEVVKAGIAAAGAQVEDFFFPVLGPGWLGHFLFNAYYPTEGSSCRLMTRAWPISLACSTLPLR